MLGKRTVHRKGKIYYEVTDSFRGEDYIIVEKKYVGNGFVESFINWTAYNKNDGFIMSKNTSAQDLHDTIEQWFAKQLMRGL